MPVHASDRITLSQNIKTTIDGVEVFAVNVFHDEAQVIVTIGPGITPTWIDVRVGSPVAINGTRYVVESISGTAGDAPEGRATGKVVLSTSADEGGQAR